MSLQKRCRCAFITLFANSEQGIRVFQIKIVDQNDVRWKRLSDSRRYGDSVGSENGVLSRNKEGNQAGKDPDCEVLLAKAFLKEEEVVTAEQSLEEAGCVTAQDPAKTVKQAMNGLQIGIAFVPIFGCVSSNPTPVTMSERVLDRLELFSNI